VHGQRQLISCLADYTKQENKNINTF